jgi:hypothetical protein
LNCQLILFNLCKFSNTFLIISLHIGKNRVPGGYGNLYSSVQYITHTLCQRLRERGCDRCGTEILKHVMPTKKFLDFSPQANHTERATPASQRSLVPNFVDRGCPVFAQRIPTAINFGFLDRSRYFLEIAPQL